MARATPWTRPQRSGRPPIVYEIKGLGRSSPLAAHHATSGTYSFHQPNQSIYPQITRWQPKSRHGRAGKSASWAAAPGRTGQGRAHMPSPCVITMGCSTISSPSGRDRTAVVRARLDRYRGVTDGPPQSGRASSRRHRRGGRVAHGDNTLAHRHDDTIMALVVSLTMLGVLQQSEMRTRAVAGRLASHARASQSRGTPDDATMPGSLDKGVRTGLQCPDIIIRTIVCSDGRLGNGRGARGQVDI